MRNKILLAILLIVLFCENSFAATSTIPIESTIGTTIAGVSAGDYAGEYALDIGDVTGDTITDYLISSYNYPISNRQGAVYLINGQQFGFPLNIQLSHVGVTTILPGTVFLGSPDRSCGSQISPAGDFDRDGKRDFLFSCSSTGSVYLVYGKERLSEVNTTIVPTSDIGTKVRGIKFTGVWSNSIDYGDIDGDGYSDFVIASGQKNTIYVCYGKSGLSGTIPIDTTNCSILTFPNGALAGTRSMRASMGDVNRDGRKDIIFTKFDDRSGGVIFGNPTRFASMTVTPLFFDGINAVNFTGYISQYIKPVGDINNDRYTDMLVTGKSAAIIFGRKTWPARIDLLNDADGSSVVSVSGLTPYFASNIAYGRSTGVGDYNHDGIGDFAIGDPETKRLIIQFGKTLWPSTISLAFSAIDGVNNIQYTSTEVSFGTSVGFIDNFLGGDTCGIEQGIIIGIPKYGYNVGKAYILNFKK